MKYFFSFLIYLLAFNLTNSFAQVKIAVLSDFTNKGAFYGEHTRNGAILALEEINQKEEKLEILFSDTKMDTKIATTEALKFVNIDQVDAVYSEFSPTSIAIASTIKNKDVLMLYSGAAQSPLETNKNAYKTFVDFIDGCKLLARKFKDLGINKIGYIGRPSETSELCHIGIKSIFKEKDIFDFELVDGSTLYSETIKLKKNNVDLVFSVNYEPEFHLMLKTFKHFKYFPKIGAFKDTITDNIKNEFRNDFFKNINYFEINIDNQEFLNRYYKKFPKASKTSSTAAALAYLHIKQLYGAITSCPNNIECQKKYMDNLGEDKDFYFSGFKNRVANFTINLGKF